MKSRKNTQLKVAIIIGALMVPLILTAQGFGSGRGPFEYPPGPGFDQGRLQKPRRGDQRGRMQPRTMHPDQMRERVNAMKIWKLTEYLELTEEQAGVFFVRLREHEAEVADINRRKRQLYEEFQKLIDEGTVKSKDVDRYFEEIAELDLSHAELRRQHIKSMDDILTDEQMAKFAVFQERFRRELRHQLQDELAPPMEEDKE